MRRNKDSLRDLWDSIKCTNICIIGVPEEKKGKVPEKILEEIIAEKFHNMGKETVTQVQENAESPRQDKPKEEQAKTHINQTDTN